MRGLAAALIAVLIVFAGTASASAQTGAGVYRHPEGLFAVSVPEGAVAQPGDAPVVVRMTSVHGWSVTIQAGKANPSLDLSGMIARLEERYLGPNRPWTAKLGQQSRQLGGLPGVELAYEGERSRWQVAIARGRLTDFVIFASAPPELFVDRGGELRDVLASFNPRTEEKPDGVAVVPQPALAPAPAPAPANPPTSAPTAEIGSPPLTTAVPSSSAVPSLAQRFDEPPFGFAIGYPADWVATREAEYRVVFAGSPGSDAFYATVAVQNVRPPAATDSAAAAGAAFDESRKQVEAAADELAVQGERAFEYDRGGTRLLGREFLASYRWQGQRFSKWVVVLPNPAHPVAHVFAYTAPEASFAAYRPIAEAMLQSWAIHGTEKDPAKR